MYRAFLLTFSLNSHSPITLEWLWEQLHRRFNSPERCHSEWLNLHCNCSLVRAVQWAVSVVMKTCDVLCVFERDTSLLAFLYHCLLPFWPFRPGQLTDCYIFFLSFLPPLHNEEVITLQLFAFAKLQERGDTERKYESNIEHVIC